MWGSGRRLLANPPGRSPKGERGDHPRNCKRQRLAGLSADLGSGCSDRRTAWLGREDSNLDMANSKLDADAFPRGANLNSLTLFETFQFREPYRIGRIQSFGDKWAIRRRMSRLWRLEVRSSNKKSLLLLRLIACKFGRNTWLWPSSRSEPGSNLLRAKPSWRVAR